MSTEPIRIFLAYSHKDSWLREELIAHLTSLTVNNLIEVWCDREIPAGDAWEDTIDYKLNEANMILLLVSADFISSGYCMGVEMKRALERHVKGEARVIPIIARPVAWESLPFANIQVVPEEGTAVTSSNWDNRDAAWRSVTLATEKVALEIQREHELRHKVGYTNNDEKGIIENLQAQLAYQRSVSNDLEAKVRVLEKSLSSEMSLRKRAEHQVFEIRSHLDIVLRDKHDQDSQPKKKDILDLNTLELQKAVDSGHSSISIAKPFVELRSPPKTYRDLIRRYSLGDRYFQQAKLRNYWGIALVFFVIIIAFALPCAKIFLQWKEKTWLLINLTSALLMIVALVLSGKMGIRGLTGVRLNGCSLRDINFRNADLHNLVMIDGNLENADLQQANLLRSRIFRSQLAEVSLTHANLRGSYLKFNDLTNANLNDTKLFHADLRHSNLSFAKLRSSDLKMALLQKCNFTKADLQKATLDFARLQNATLINTFLKGASLRSANLTKANLTNADLSETNLEGANLKDAILENTFLKLAVYDFKTQWPEGFPKSDSFALGPGSILVGKNLSNRNLLHVNLSGAVLRAANLKSSRLKNLYGADLSDANLERIKIGGGTLRSAKLIRAKLSKADFSAVPERSGADSFADADCVCTNFTGADLKHVIFGNADMRGACFVGADLSGAKLVGKFEWAVKHSGPCGNNWTSHQSKIFRANIYGATFDEKTIWPEGIDPVSMGAVPSEK